MFSGDHFSALDPHYGNETVAICFLLQYWHDQIFIVCTLSGFGELWLKDSMMPRPTILQIMTAPLMFWITCSLLLVNHRFMWK
jgi:hypothetical protein